MFDKITIAISVFLNLKDVNYNSLYFRFIKGRQEAAGDSAARQRIRLDDNQKCANNRELIKILFRARQFDCRCRRYKTHNLTN